MTSLQNQRLKQIGALLLIGVIIIPVSAYVVGSYIVGPYAGNAGLAGYVGTIYLAAWRGELAALVLLLGPVLVAGIWVITLRLSRN